MSRGANQLLQQRIAAWRSAGQTMQLGGQQIYCFDRAGTDSNLAPLLIIHGFPGSSFDFAQTIDYMDSRRRIIALDLLGYGLSAKPLEAKYSLFEQADLVEDLLQALAIERVVILSHDMGDTVAAELLHRERHGQTQFAVEQTVLTNGSIFIDLAQLTRGQRLSLALPARPLPFSPPRRVLERALEESFAKSAPAPPGAIDALVEMIRVSGGDRLTGVQIRYINERRQHQSRWTDALVMAPAPMTALWGALDPIAVSAMPRRLKQLRPDLRMHFWDDLGHWPQLEAPERFAEAVSQVTG